MKTGNLHSSKIVILLMLALSFFVTAAAQTGPTVTNLSPSAGPVSPVGGPISIKGSGFGATQGSSTVTVGGIIVTPSSWTATKIVVPVLASLPVGFDDVVVTVNGVASNARSFLVIPVITSVSPPNGVVGTLVTITGTSFGDQQGTSTITFNGITTTPTQWSSTSITAPLSNTSGMSSIVVTVNGFATNGAPFPVVPSISAVQPAAVLPGGAVTITGAGFGAAPGTVSQITLNGIAATIQSWSTNSVTATVPAGASSGNVLVTASNGKTSAPFGLTVLLPNPVTITPATTVVGSVVSLTGTSFGTEQADSTVTLGSLSLTVVSWTDGEVRAIVPSGAASGEVLATVQGVVYGAQLNVISASTTGILTTFQYDSKGELISVTDPLSHGTSLTYTTAGLVQSIADALGNLTQFQYDAAGNRTTATDALHNVTLFTYDTMNRLTKVTFADGSTNQFVYDSRGRTLSSTDANGNITSLSYDDADRVVSVTDANGGLTQYSYDAENNLGAISDALARQTTFAYDDLRRVTQTTFPSGLTESYVYDADGNVLTRTDRNGHGITYSYDALNRLTGKVLPDGTNVSYGYDLADQLAQVTDSSGTYGFTYDNVGRLIGTTTQYNSIPGKTFAMAYAYDNASNRTALTDAQGAKTSYAYDALNRLVSTTDANANIFGFSYDSLGRRTSLTRPNGINTNYSYDGLSNLLTVAHKNGSTTIDGASYTYDPVRNRSSKSSPTDGTTSIYKYDNLHQLKSVMQGANTVESYSYDAVGNRLSSLALSYSYNNANELTAAGPGTYTYDNNGNTTSRSDASGVTQFGWDAENRLVSVTLPGGNIVSFRYDPFGRRIQKGTSIFLYDENDLMEQLDLSGALTARYSLGGGIDDTLASYQGGLATFYEVDGLGSTTSLSSSAGSISANSSYDSYGNLTSSTGAFSQPFGFTGREYDPETGLYFYRARYYDSSAGRFLSEDPLRHGGGVNFYSYVRNNPVNNVDPSGLLDVFIWNYRGSTTSWGHASITLANGEHISWWPSGEDQHFLFGTSKIPIYSDSAIRNQQLAGDIQGEEGNLPDEIIHIEGLDEAAIADWWEKYRLDRIWKSTRRNCSTTVAHALMAGGAQHVHHLIWTPNNVRKYAEKLAGQLPGSGFVPTEAYAAETLTPYHWRPLAH